MKIFEFDPQTGKRGKLIGSARRGNYTDQSVAYQVREGMIEPIAHAQPRGFGKNANVTVHVDAGREFPVNQFNSYRRDQWICYSYGAWMAGPDQQIWEWVILPPSDLVKAVEVA